MIKEKNLLINDVIRTIAYFDVFNYPLTSQQVYNFLPRNSVSPKDIALLLEEMMEQKIIARCGEYFCLPASDRYIGEKRKNNEKRAKRFILYARMMTRFLKLFPFVRAVFITGSLSKNVASKESDIDFMIVTASQRLWICKTVLSLFRKAALFGSHKYFCTNYYVSENNFSHSECNIYSAIEIVTTKPAWNTKAFR